MEIPGSWQELRRNKPALIGLGLAGVVGLFVWFRRRSTSGGGGSSAGTSTSGTGSAGGVGTFDSTGTDIASFLGDFSGRLDTQLGGYISQLNTTVDALKQAGSTTTVGVQGGQHVSDIVSQVARYRPGFTESDLQALNPGTDIFTQADAQGFVGPEHPDNPADPGTLISVFGGPGFINIPRP